MLYNAWNKVIKLYGDYSTVASEAKYKTIHGQEIKILTPKQMLQRLPITFAQVKVGTTSENLLNKIRQIIYSLDQSKEITKYTTILQIQSRYNTKLIPHL